MVDLLERFSCGVYYLAPERARPRWAADINSGAARSNDEGVILLQPIEQVLIWMRADNDRVRQFAHASQEENQGQITFLLAAFLTVIRCLSGSR
jgi:hypothetical protein